MFYLKVRITTFKWYVQFCLENELNTYLPRTVFLSICVQTLTVSSEVYIFWPWNVVDRHLRHEVSLARTTFCAVCWR